MSNRNWGTTILIATAGHVWVAKSITFDGDFYHLHNARAVRRWGTDNGINQLVKGPLKGTVLDDPAPLVTVMPMAVIALIPCDDDKWPAW